VRAVAPRVDEPLAGHSLVFIVFRATRCVARIFLDEQLNTDQRQSWARAAEASLAEAAARLLALRSLPFCIPCRRTAWPLGRSPLFSGSEILAADRCAVARSLHRSCSGSTFFRYVESEYFSLTPQDPALRWRRSRTTRSHAWRWCRFSRGVSFACCPGLDLVVLFSLLYTGNEIHRLIIKTVRWKDVLFCAPPPALWRLLLLAVGTRARGGKQPGARSAGIKLNLFSSPAAL